MSKRYSLTGVGASIELSLGGPLLKNNAGVIEVRNNADSALANLSVATPVANDHATPKFYVDQLVQGLSWKSPGVRVAALAAGTLATDFENGDVVNGVTLATGDRILLAAQASGIENGIYVVNATGAPTRADDFAAGASVANAAVFAAEGTVGADTAYTVTNNSGADVVGTDALTISPFGSISPGITTITSSGGQTLIQTGTAPSAVLKDLTSTTGAFTFTDAGATLNLDIADDHITSAEEAPTQGTYWMRAVVNAGDASGTAIGTFPAFSVSHKRIVQVTTAFDGTPTMELGNAGATGELMASALINLAAIDDYHDEGPVTPTATGAIATHNAASSTVGACVIFVQYMRTA